MANPNNYNRDEKAKPNEMPNPERQQRGSQSSTENFGNTRQSSPSYQPDVKKQSSDTNRDEDLDMDKE